MMTDRYRWICKQQAEDVFTNQEVLTLVINSGDRNRDLIPAFLKYRGTWESSGVPNIELAMMQLIHSRKALETDYNTCRNYRI
jgi:hypothetical protein